MILMVVGCQHQRSSSPSYGSEDEEWINISVPQSRPYSQCPISRAVAPEVAWPDLASGGLVLKLHLADGELDELVIRLAFSHAMQLALSGLVAGCMEGRSGLPWRR